MALALDQVLKSDHAALGADEALRAPVDVLLGVSAAARGALEAVTIRTVFDLAASDLFATAALLLSAETDPALAEVRLNTAAADAVVPPPGVPVGEWARRYLSLLAGLSAAQATALSDALDVRTVRDLALWPPYITARTLLQETFGGDTAPEPDPEAPADLVPRSGGYATERVFFKKLVIELAPQAAQGATPVEQLNGIDLDAALAAPTGFQRLATGALLTFKQSWFSHGVTLGQLLHSLTLAPGESTRVAVIDWTRRSSARAAESIDERERLANEQTHTRALSEVTSSTASEFQAGSSSTSVTSSTGQTGASLGLEIGPLAFGGSHGGSSSTTEAMSASSSFGARDLAASLSQTINDRTQQNASAARGRRASAVREVSQSEHETITTRVVTNYNHMHALTVQYYETVQAYRVTTELDRAERCLFVPLKLLNFRNVATVDRLRSTLAQVALTPAAFRQLTSEYGAVAITPQTPRVIFGNVGLLDLFVRDRVVASSAPSGAAPARVTSRARRASAAAELARSTVAASGGVAAAATESTTVAAPASGTTAPASLGAALGAVRFDQGPANAPTAVAAVKGWNLAQLNLLGSLSGQSPLRRGSDSAFVPHDALLLGVALRDGQSARFQVRTRENAELPAHSATATSYILATPVAFSAVQHISLQNAQDRDVTTTLVLSVNVNGAVVALDVPVQYKSKATAAGLQEVIRFGETGPAPELVEHLEANRLHYSRAIFQRLDGAAIGGLLARFTYRGLALARVVDPRPVAITSNFLVFRVNVPLEGGVDDDRFTAEQSEFKAFLQARGLDRPAPQSQIVALPSGGVFAEAVLGRFNSAEKIDLTRFWNWQDSPIPITAPEIAPVAAGSRAEEETLRPGQLGAPVVTIQSPTPLPAAAGVGPMLAAIQTANLFRDMSGMAQTAALAQSAVQASGAGATAAGDQAAQNLKTVMEQNTQRMKIAADMLTAVMAPGAGTAAAAGAGTGTSGAPSSGGKGTDSHAGGVLNAAKAIDQQAAPDAAAPSSGGTPAPTGSLEKETLARQTGSDVASAAEKLVESATAPATPPASKPTRRTTARPAPTPTPPATPPPSPTPAGPAEPTSAEPPPAPIPVRYRLKITFGTSDGVALEGSRNAKVHETAFFSSSLISEAAGLPGQALYLSFQTIHPSVSLNVSVQPRSNSEWLSGAKSLVFPPLGMFAPMFEPGTLPPRELSVVVRPSIKKETFTIPFTGPVLQPDLANLEQQLTAKGIEPTRRIGDPDYTLIFGTGYRATVRWFTGSLIVQQIL